MLHAVVFLGNHCTIITCNSAKYCDVPNEAGSLHIKCLKFSAEAVKSLMETRKHAPRHKGTCCRHIFVVLQAVNQKDQEVKYFGRIMFYVQLFMKLSVEELRIKC